MIPSIEANILTIGEYYIYDGRKVEFKGHSAPREKVTIDGTDIIVGNYRKSDNGDIQDIVKEIIFREEGCQYYIHGSSTNDGDLYVFKEVYGKKWYMFNIDTLQNVTKLDYKILGKLDISSDPTGEITEEYIERVNETFKSIHYMVKKIDDEYYIIDFN